MSKSSWHGRSPVGFWPWSRRATLRMMYSLSLNCQFISMTAWFLSKELLTSTSGSRKQQSRLWPRFKNCHTACTVGLSYNRSPHHQEENAVFLNKQKGSVCVYIHCLHPCLPANPPGGQQNSVWQEHRPHELHQNGDKHIGSRWTCPLLTVSMTSSCPPSSVAESKCWIKSNFTDRVLLRNTLHVLLKSFHRKQQGGQEADGWCDEGRQLGSVLHWKRRQRLFTV